MNQKRLFHVNTKSADPIECRARAWPPKSFHRTLSYDNKGTCVGGGAGMKGSASVNKNCGCEWWMRWPCDLWPPSPWSIQSSTMVDTCVLSVLALLLFTSVSGRDRKRPEVLWSRARHPHANNTPLSLYRCLVLLPFYPSFPSRLPASSFLIVSDKSKHLGGRRGSTSRCVYILWLMICSSGHVGFGVNRRYGRVRPLSS